MNIKVNDKVCIVNSPYAHQALSNGETGVVIFIDREADYIDVRMDSGFEKDGDDLWPFCESELELVG